MAPGLERWILEGACLATCVAAAFCDLRTLRIPNTLTLPAALVGVAAATSLGASRGEALASLLSSAGGLCFGLVAFGLLSARGLVGFGDTKLMAAVGSFLGWPQIAHAALYALVAGGFLALGLALRRGLLSAVVSRIPDAARGRTPIEQVPEVHRMPYGLAILFGTLWAILAGHLPRLAVL